MSPPLLPSNAYYLVSSDRYGSGVFLAAIPSAGGEDDGSSPGTLSLTKYSFSSQNWQIFYQEPVYFIRNFDYKAEYQLGIPQDSPTQPALLPSSGSLMQQWNISLWDDGTHKLTSMELGDVQVLGVGIKDDQPILVMNAAQNGSHWSFDPNPSDATTNVTDGMLQSVSVQAVRYDRESACAASSIDSGSQVSSPTSTLSPHSTSGSTAISSPPAETRADVTSSIFGSVPSSSSSVSTSSQPTASRSLSGGVIAGIVVAIVAAALVIVGLVFLFRQRKRRQRHPSSANQSALAPQKKKALPTLLQEADTRHAPVEMGTSNEREEIQIFDFRR